MRAFSRAVSKSIFSRISQTPFLPVVLPFTTGCTPWRQTFFKQIFYSCPYDHAVFQPEFGSEASVSFLTLCSMTANISGFFRQSALRSLRISVRLEFQSRFIFLIALRSTPSMSALLSVAVLLASAKHMSASGGIRCLVLFVRRSLPAWPAAANLESLGAQPAFRSAGAPPEIYTSSRKGG